MVRFERMKDEYLTYFDFDDIYQEIQEAIIEITLILSFMTTVRPFVEGVWPNDGWTGQLVDSRALVFKRAQDLPSSLAHESLLGSIQVDAEEKEGCKA